MQRALFLLLAVSCGGKLDGQASDAGIGEDASDPLGGGGMMLKGPCRFGSAFRPRDMKMEWITLTKDNVGISTVSRAESPFTLVCSGKGSDGFYYAIRMTPVSAAVGVQAAMGDMYQSANGREAERAFGECTVDVRALGASMGKRTVDGSFDCPALFADPIGHFHLDGVFTVPLP
jgi:hypothetical protein